MSEARERFYQQHEASGEYPTAELCYKCGGVAVIDGLCGMCADGSRHQPDCDDDPLRGVASVVDAAMDTLFRR